MKILTWNVNGLRGSIRKGLIEELEKINADIICLQEIKARKNQIKHEFQGYSGVLTLSKYQPINVCHGFGIEKFDILLKRC